MESAFVETQDKHERIVRLRQKLRALTNKMVPNEWGVIKGLIFRRIDNASPKTLEDLREELIELLNER